MSDNKKIKVCHVLNRLDVGGMENGVVNICNKLDRNVFLPIICCIKGGGDMIQRLREDVCCEILNFREGKSLLRLFAMAKYFKKIRPDIVHTHGWGACSFDGIVGAKMAKVPVIINGEHGTFFLKWYQIIIQKILSKLCDITLSVSESLQNEIVSNIGISESKIKVIPNGVCIEVFTGIYDTKNLKEELAKDFGITIKDESFVIGCIGSLKPLKNQMMLLKAVNIIKTNRHSNKCIVLFIGDGPDRQSLEQYVVNEKLQEYVYFLGIRDDTPQLLSLMDILVSTSISEGMSNVFLEAMSSKLPVIATKCEGAKELIRDGVNGFLIELNDVMALSNKFGLLLNDEILLKKMSYNARQFICANYSIQKMVSAYENIYENSLNLGKV
ncbi:glycosyltransferase [Elusimicrobiota bacterium]